MDGLRSWNRRWRSTLQKGASLSTSHVPACNMNDRNGSGPKGKVIIEREEKLFPFAN